MEQREEVPNRELRYCASRLRLEKRAEGDEAKRVIVGHGSVFNQWTTLYESKYYVWREIIRPGAFRNAIAEKQDVRCLWNHDPNFILGRTVSGTLELSEDEVGLLYRNQAPDTQTIRDLVLAPIDRKDVDGSSFAFAVRRGEQSVITEADGVTVYDFGGERVTLREEGARTVEERELLDVDLFDVSPVTYPQYKQADAALRALTAQRETEVRANRARRLAGMRMRLRLAKAR